MSAKGEQCSDENEDYEPTGDEQYEDGPARYLPEGRPLGIVEQGARRRGLTVAAVAQRATEAKLDEVGERLLHMLHYYKVLRGRHLRDLLFFGQKESLVKRRGYTLLAALERLEFVREFRLKDGEGGYVLGAAGRAWLKHYEGLKAEPRDLVSLLGTRGDRTQHDVLISDFMVPIWKDALSLGGQFYWRNIKDNPDPDGYAIVRWDGLGDLAIGGDRYVFFLEADR